MSIGAFIVDGGTALQLTQLLASASQARSFIASAPRNCKVNALPSLILVGRDGKIIKRYGGEADKGREKRMEK